MTTLDTATDLSLDIEIMFLEESSMQCGCVDSTEDHTFHVMPDSPIIDWDNPSIHRCSKEATWMAVLTFTYRNGNMTSPHYFCDLCFSQWQDLASMVEKL